MNEITNGNLNNEETQFEFENLLSVDLLKNDIQRLSLFYSSKLNETQVCQTTVNIFTTLETKLIDCSIKKPINRNLWKWKASGSLILQINYDRFVTDEVCGIRIIIANPQTCDHIWSTSLHSWNQYLTVDEDFHVFTKSKTPKDKEKEEILEDFSVGIYFSKVNTAKEFHQFFSTIMEKLRKYENQSGKERKKSIRKYKINLKKKEQITKSNISAPIMFIHTLHIDK